MSALSWLRIADLVEGAAVEGFYAVRDANLQFTTAGKPYMRLILADASGTIVANLWDITTDEQKTVAAGDIVKVRGQVESYRSALQLKLSNLRRATAADKIDASRFLPVTPGDRQALRQEWLRLANSIKDADYRQLLADFAGDEVFMDAFCRAPAAKENHHAYVGGLLEHTVSVARLAEALIAGRTASVNADLLFAGALLHDVGKVWELRADAIIEYTDTGRLVGHLVLGCLCVQERAKRLGQFPSLKLDLLLHMILSHHGQREFGSPVLPAIPEALALHHLDNLDAKTNAAQHLIGKDTNSRSRWTERSWMLDTALFKGINNSI